MLLVYQVASFSSSSSFWLDELYELYELFT